MPATLADTLRRYLPLVLNLNTEKARSEFMIAPILIELKLLFKDRLSLFSGLDFNIADEDGRCIRLARGVSRRSIRRDVDPKAWCQPSNPGRK